MLRSKLAKILFVSSVVSSVSFCGALDDIVNGAINKAVGNIGLDSLVSVDCSFFQDFDNIRFSVAGCGFEIDTKKCYGQTLEGFKDVFDLRYDVFDKDAACGSFLAKEKEWLFDGSPYSPSEAIHVKKLPASVFDKDKKVSKEVTTMVSRDYLSVSNGLELRNRILRQAKRECSLSSNKASCALKKAISLARQELKKDDKQEEAAYKTARQNEYLAISEEGDLFRVSDKILKKMPIDKKNSYLSDAIKTQYLSAFEKAYSSANSAALNSVFDKFADVVARSVSLGSLKETHEIARKSIEKLELP